MRAKGFGRAIFSVGANDIVLNAPPIRRRYPTTILYFDGLCEPVNPGGVATYGFVVYVGKAKVKEGCGLVGAGMLGDDVSNNVAEYTALIRGMEYALSNCPTEHLLVRGDSLLVVNQMLGKYAVKAQRMLPLNKQAVDLKNRLPSVEFEWVPRERNEEADALSRVAFSQFLEEHRSSFERYYHR